MMWRDRKPYPVGLVLLAGRDAMAARRRCPNHGDDGSSDRTRGQATREFAPDCRRPL